MNTQPEALRLAELLDWYYEDRGPADEKKAAAELRRLHENFEAAKAVGIQQEAEIMRLEAVNTELLEALMAMLENKGDYTKLRDTARAAIAKATREQA